MPAVLDFAAVASASVARAISSASAAASDDALSQGDIFGMFLTLCVCLVAQPSGSLLYRPWSLPIWRLNPLASLAEAMLIAYCFAVHILFVLLDGISTPTDPHATDRWQRSLSRMRLFYHHFVAEMHAVAAALLLIRSDMNRTEGTPADMVDEMIAKGLFDESSGNDEDEEEDEAQDASQVQAQNGDLGHGVDDADDVDGVSAFNESVRSESGPAQDAGQEEPYLFALRAAMLPGLRPAPPWTPPLLFYVAAGLGPGERAADLGTSNGAADVSAKADADAGAPCSTALRHALGAGVIAHREFTVQAATVLSILSITVKLFTSSLPAPLQICGLSMLAGWIAVQVTLVIFHAGHVDGTRMRHISRKVRDLQFLYRPPETNEALMLSFTLPWLCALIPVAYPIIRLAIYCFTPSKDIGQEPTVLYLAGR